MSEQDNPRNAIVTLAIVVEGGLVLLALLLGWLLEQPPLSRFALEWRDVLWGLLAAVPMLVLFLVMGRWPVGPLRSLKEFTDNVIRPVMAPCTLVDLLGISCLAGLGEEMVFRGVVQDVLAEKTGLWAGVVLASLLFGLMHAVTPTYALLAAGMGVYLGWLYVETGNLLAPMVTHAAYDFAVLVWLLRGPGSETIEAAEEEPLEEEELEDDPEEE